MAVSRPLKYKYCSWWTKYILPAVWIASLALPILAGVSNMNIKDDIFPNNKTYCISNDNIKYGFVTLSVGFFLPQVVIVTLYSMIAYKLWTRRVPGEQRDAQRQNDAQQTAKKVTRMIVCVLFAFEICWAPVFLFCMAQSYISFQNLSDLRPLLSLIFGLISLSNGSFNALIYAVFNKNFRGAFKTALRIEQISIRCRTVLNRMTNKPTTMKNNSNTQNAIDPLQNRVITISSIQ
jgi:hypothetical protein